MMNKLLYKFFFVVAAFLFATEVLAQVPQGFNFQAVARDAEGELITNSNLGVKISVLQGTDSGEAVYTETQTPTTNEVGLFMLVIGEGTSEDDFMAIDWSSDNYYVKLEIDSEGGTEYEELGTTRLLSVPYALLSQDVVNGVSVGEDLITQYHLNTSQGDTSFIVNATGATGLVAIRGNSSTDGSNRGVYGAANSEASNTNTMYGVTGTASGEGTGSHLGVFGSAINADATTGNRYGVYGQASSQSKYTYGLFGYGFGPGNGDEGEGYGEGSINFGVRGSATGNSWNNSGLEAEAFGTAGKHNYGVNGLSHAGTEETVENRGVSGRAWGPGINYGVYGAAWDGVENYAGYFDGNTVVNGDLTVNGTINSGEFGSGTSNVSASNENGDIVGTMSYHGEQDKQGFLHLYGETAPETDNLRAALEVTDNGSGITWGSLYLKGPVDDRNFVEASVSNDPNGNDPEGWSGHLNLWGTNSPNIQMRGMDWENSDLPQITLFGNKPSGDGWFYDHANLSVNYDGENQWGNLSLNANDGVPNFSFGSQSWINSELPMFEMYGNNSNPEGGYFSHFNLAVNEDGSQQWANMQFKSNDDKVNIEIGAKSWEDATEGAGRPFMAFKGNIPDEDLIWMEVSDNGSNEFGNINFNSTDGSHLSINAYGLNGDVNIDGGNLHVSGDITAGGSITETSDRNLKENIQPLDNALSTIMKLNPSTYNFRGNGNYKGLQLSTGLHYGLIAQEVESILPSLVKNNVHRYTETQEEAVSGPSPSTQVEVEKTMEYKSMNYTELIPVLIKAVQEQQNEIDKLQKELEALKNKR